MIGVYTGGVYGGSRSAVLLNIPGAPAAVATGFDGYPLAKLGEAGKAIGLSTTASVIGGVHGGYRLRRRGARHLGILAHVCAEGLFPPRDHGNPSCGEPLRRVPGKGGFRGCAGCASQHGRDGHLYRAGDDSPSGVSGLMSGIHFVAIMIGIFGVSEAFVQLHELHVKPIKQDVSKDSFPPGGCCSNTCI